MSPELVAKAKRERWAREANSRFVGLLRNWFYLATHPRIAVFVFRIRMHYSFGWKYPPVPM